MINTPRMRKQRANNINNNSNNHKTLIPSTCMVVGGKKTKKTTVLSQRRIFLRDWPFSVSYIYTATSSTNIEPIWTFPRKRFVHDMFILHVNSKIFNGINKSPPKWYHSLNRHRLEAEVKFLKNGGHGCSMEGGRGFFFSLKVFIRTLNLIFWHRGNNSVPWKYKRWWFFSSTQQDAVVLIVK